MSSNHDILDISGHLDYVMARALYEFIKLQQSLPDDTRCWTDERVAKALLLRMGEYWGQALARYDEANGETPARIWTRPHAIDNA